MAPSTAPRKALRQQRTDLVAKLEDLAERREAIASRLSALDFTYSDPTPDFDRSKVKGLVATLAQLDKEPPAQVGVHFSAPHKLLGSFAFDVMEEANDNPVPAS